LSFKQLEIFCSLIPSTSVEVLQLEWNPTIGKCQTDDEKNHDVTPVYARLIEGDSPLVSLSLRCNGITCAGAKALAKALRQNKKLERLNLFQNEIRDEGALEIAYSLPWNSALKHLSLANNLLSGIA
jgi:Ran GTPase-activating protein (RanGAP) involved in mRNA processing and transport